MEKYRSGNAQIEVTLNSKGLPLHQGTSHKHDGDSLPSQGISFKEHPEHMDRSQNKEDEDQGNDEVEKERSRTEVLEDWKVVEEKEVAGKEVKRLEV